MGTLSVWDAASGRLHEVAGRHRGSIKTVVALPARSGKTGWVTCGRDGRVRVHAGGTVREIEVGPTIVNGVAVSADGAQIAAVSRGRGVELYETASGRRLAAFTEHRVSARAVAFAPDGSHVAAGYYDGSLLLWQPERAEARLLRPFGRVPVSALRFAPDGRSLLVASWAPSGSFLRLDVASGETLAAGVLAGSGL
jgi:WD40 repeat protein